MWGYPPFGGCGATGTMGSMGFVIRVIINAFSLWVVTLIGWLGVSVSPFDAGGDFAPLLTFAAVGAFFALVNSILGTVIKVVAFPLYILTLGLISLVVNGFLLWLTAAITSGLDWGLEVESFWLGVIAAVLIGIINAILGAILRPKKKRR